MSDANWAWAIYALFWLTCLGVGGVVVTWWIVRQLVYITSGCAA